MSMSSAYIRQKKFKFTAFAYACESRQKLADLKFINPHQFAMKFSQVFDNKVVMELIAILYVELIDC